MHQSHRVLAGREARARRPGCLPYQRGIRGIDRADLRPIDVYIDQAIAGIFSIDQSEIRADESQLGSVAHHIGVMPGVIERSTRSVSGPAAAVSPGIVGIIIGTCWN